MAYFKGYGWLLTGLLAFGTVACFDSKEEEEEEEEGTSGTSGISGTSGTSDTSSTSGTASTSGSSSTSGTSSTSSTSGGSADVSGSQNVIVDTDAANCTETYDLVGYNTGWCSVCTYSFNADLLATADATCGFGDLNQDLGFLVGYADYPDSLVYAGSTYIYLMADLTSVGGGNAEWYGQLDLDGSSLGTGTLAYQGNASY